MPQRVSYPKAVFVITSGVSVVALAAAWYANQGPVRPAGSPDGVLETVPTGVPSSASAGALRAPAPSAPTRSAALPPAGREEAPLDPEQRAQADAIASALRDGPTLAGCRAAETTLLAFARGVSPRSAAWNWAIGRARDCLRAPHEFRKDNALLKGLLESFPDDPIVRQLAGLQSYDDGRLDDAVAQLEDAVEEKGSFEAWESYADAQLSRALQMRSRGEPGWQDVLMQAEAAAMRALELADDQSLPLALHTVARTQLEMGRAAEAIQWADQAVAALQAGSSRYQAVMTAELYVFSGQIYYRAGQRDTGMAYMDQGIASAASPQQQAELQRIRDEFLRRYGG
jgi:tetratricopeptide (TPR) repeat protein